MYRGSIVVLLVSVLLISGILVACGVPAKGAAEWHANQAYELAKQGRYEEAIEECNKAIELDPGLAEPMTTGASPTTT